MKPPTVEDIDRIARLNDPILRNLQITQCYHELSESEVITEGFDDPSLVEHKSSFDWDKL